MTNYQKLLKQTIDEMAAHNIYRSESTVSTQFEDTVQCVKVQGYRTTDNTFFYSEKKAIEYEKKWLMKDASVNEPRRKNDRLTARNAGKVFINPDVKKISGCMMDPKTHFCINASECESVRDRTCPFLMVLDKLASIEDKEEAEKTEKQ